MHELPELDVYRAALTEYFAGAQITGIEVTNVKVFQASPEQLERDIVGKMVWFVERRGKHLIFHLDNGKRIMLHLSLGAYLYKGTDDDQPSRAAQVIIRFASQTLYIIGLRADDMQMLTVKGIEEQLGQLGPDPFDKRLNLDSFIERFAKKRGSLKAALIDQHVLSGIGSIYADEICFEAAVRPDAKIPALDSQAWERIYVAMHKVLKEAISLGGVDDQPFSANDNLTGGYNDHLQVHNREGQPCHRCGATIERINVSARKAFVCLSCQKDQ